MDAFVREELIKSGSIVSTAFDDHMTRLRDVYAMHLQDRWLGKLTPQGAYHHKHP